MFFIFTLNKKPKGKENKMINYRGMQVNAIITVYKTYFELFFIPLIPFSKKYSIYIPHFDDYYENGMFSEMPDELLEICKQVGRNY